MKTQKLHLILRPWTMDDLENMASQRALEKAGMRLEACFEKSLFKNGEFLDEFIYSILSSSLVVTT